MPLGYKKGRLGIGKAIKKYFKIDFDGMIKFVHLQSL
jgi:hypothetical protein